MTYTLLCTYTHTLKAIVRLSYKICMHICTYTLPSIYTYTYTQNVIARLSKKICIQLYIHIHTRFYIHHCTCMYIYANIYVHTYTHIHTYTPAHVHIYVYVWIHIHVYIWMYVHTYIVKISSNCSAVLQSNAASNTQIVQHIWWGDQTKRKQSPLLFSLPRCVKWSIIFFFLVGKQVCTRAHVCVHVCPCVFLLNLPRYCLSYVYVYYTCMCHHIFMCAHTIKTRTSVYHIYKCTIYIVYHIYMCTIYIYVCILHTHMSIIYIGCLKLQVSFRKKAT